MSTEQSFAIARAGRGVNPPKGSSATGIQRSQQPGPHSLLFLSHVRIDLTMFNWSDAALKCDIKHQGMVKLVSQVLISCDLPDCEHLATYCVRASDRLHPNPDTQQKYMWPDASFLKSAYSDNYTATTHAMYTWPKTYIFCLNIRIIHIYIYIFREISASSINAHRNRGYVADMAQSTWSAT